MTWLTVEGRGGAASSQLAGAVALPGDKSMSHRALMLGALSEGTHRVQGFLPSGDCLATLGCMRALGVQIEPEGSAGMTSLVIHGRGLHGLCPPAGPMDCQRSGTTMRLLAGILAGQTFDSVLVGDPQLLRRPMRRITEPLRQMGAEIADTDGHGPLFVRGGAQLCGGTHDLAVASAQVKSAILLAGLYADGPVVVHQPGPARDHTERMLAAQIEPRAAARVPLSYDTVGAVLDPGAIARLRPLDRVIPGDASSAAFPLVAALLISRSEILLVGVGVNPTRTGLFDVLRSMGADVTLENRRDEGGEPVADLRVRASGLVGTEVCGETVVRMIDEFPILAVAATQAEGTTLVRDAAELRVKETDRIATVVEELRKLGARIEPRPDGFVVEGPTPLVGAEVKSHGDHRLAMALVIAGLVAEGETHVLGAEAIPDSFPGFAETLGALGARVHQGM